MSRFVDFKAVKAAVTLLQVLEHYGLAESFKRTGNSLSGPCPLHGGQNRTQFRVSLEKNCWNCFGTCKGGGNIMDFVAHKEGCSLREAALKLCDWFQLPTEEKSPRPDTDATGTPPVTPPKAERPPKSTKPKKQDADEDGPNKPLGFVLQNVDPEYHNYSCNKVPDRIPLGEYIGRLERIQGEDAYVTLVNKATREQFCARIAVIQLTPRNVREGDRFSCRVWASAQSEVVEYDRLPPEPISDEFHAESECLAAKFRL